MSELHDQDKYDAARTSQMAPAPPVPPVTDAARLKGLIADLRELEDDTEGTSRGTTRSLNTETWTAWAADIARRAIAELSLTASWQEERARLITERDNHERNRIEAIQAWDRENELRRDAEEERARLEGEGQAEVTFWERKVHAAEAQLVGVRTLLQTIHDAGIFAFESDRQRVKDTLAALPAVQPQPEAKEPRCSCWVGALTRVTHVTTQRQFCQVHGQSAPQPEDKL